MHHTLAYRNGIYLPKDQLYIESDDLGFERGFAVFDYCRERNGRITFLRDHLERFAHSQSILNLQNPIGMDVVKDVFEKMQMEDPLGDSYFKMMISARMADEKIYPILTVYRDPFKHYPLHNYEEGIALIIEDFAKPFPEYKTTFYLGSLRQYLRMRESGAEDVLFYSDNLVRECARCNIFIVKGDTIYTPGNKMLKGVTRKHVLACAKQQFFVVENDITVEELFQADEVFITSTTKNIMPVRRIEDRDIGTGKPGIVTQHMMKLFDEYCDQYVAD